jgi:molybdate transport system permease protein
MIAAKSSDSPPNTHTADPGTPLYAALLILSAVYVFLIAAMLTANASYTSFEVFRRTLASPEIQYAIKLSLVTSSITTVLSLWVATALSYSLSRFNFRGKFLVDALLDVPIVLPPLVVGLSLLMLSSTAPGA